MGSSGGATLEHEQKETNNYARFGALTQGYWSKDFGSMWIFSREDTAVSS